MGRARADDLLERFDLTDAADRPARTYSGGMRRRLDLAAALVHHPPVLFLDEPTTGLDPRSRLGLWDVIENLRAEGTTVLLTTQYLEEADRLANEIAVIDRGHVIAQGTSAELKARLGATVLEVAFADELSAQRAVALLEAGGRHRTRHDGHLVEIDIDAGAREVMSALRTLDEAGIEPGGLTLREPSLDDVFLTLTGHRAVEAGGGDAAEEAG
jgi:ABC-type multidrug transport system ATPase subunit